MADFKVRFSNGGKSLPISFSDDAPQRFKAEMGETQIVNIGAPPYRGEYTVTPTANGTVLKTKNTRMTDDVTIKAIPEKYGLVTYDQSKTITVS